MNAQCCVFKPHYQRKWKEMQMKSQYNAVVEPNLYIVSYRFFWKKKTETVLNSL